MTTLVDQRPADQTDPGPAIPQRHFPKGICQQHGRILGPFRPAGKRDAAIAHHLGDRIASLRVARRKDQPQVRMDLACLQPTVQNRPILALMGRGRQHDPVSRRIGRRRLDRGRRQQFQIHDRQDRVLAQPKIAQARFACRILCGKGIDSAQHRRNHPAQPRPFPGRAFRHPRPDHGLPNSAVLKQARFQRPQLLFDGQRHLRLHGIQKPAKRPRQVQRRKPRRQAPADHHVAPRDAVGGDLKAEIAGQCLDDRAGRSQFTDRCPVNPDACGFSRKIANQPFAQRFGPAQSRAQSQDGFGQSGACGIDHWKRSV